jgi:FixJ family two-component response regulator
MSPVDGAASLIPAAMPRKTRQLLLDQLAKLVAVVPFRPLTASEQRVANLIGMGLSYKAIGRQLKMSPRTVQHHVGIIAGLIPDDGLPARERVQVWAACVVLPELVEMLKKVHK